MPGESRLIQPQKASQLEQVRRADLTCPQIVQKHHEAPGEVEGVVESVAEEGGHVKGGEQGSGGQGHDPAAEDHQPHQQERCSRKGSRPGRRLASQ